ncbi:MAG: UDP-N-acetylmuramate dehydrogenase [Odoribacter sp.]|nr:UDP-N-acetylmuramate dehydrogenase [Odoribacter sp.]
MRIEENFDLKAYNTFNISCRCKYFMESDKKEDFMELAADYELQENEILILGGGSNFLFTEDYDGTVLYPTMKGIEIIEKKNDKTLVRVGAGEDWDDFVLWTVENGLGGMENLSLIPGHVGASPVQNVGAYGVEAGDRIKQVEAINLEDGTKRMIEKEACRFGYRDSIFKNEWKNRYLITYVIFELDNIPHFNLAYGHVREYLENTGKEINLKNVRQAIIDIRNSKLPDVKELPNAGSFFKNPIVIKEFALSLKEKYPELPLYAVGEEDIKLSAAWLIDKAGWKGKRIGDAGVHEKQSLVLVNYGNTEGVDITKLANEIKKSVFMQFGIWIEPEVNII